MDKSSIEEFYANKTVFITGGTGFMGKALIEKLLRSCPDIKTIYMLVRSKKGKDMEKRIEEIICDPLFNLLKEKQGKFAEKIIPIAGDISQKGLGLSNADKQLIIKEVQVVFHAAATVKFDEKLRLATAINVKGTKDLLNMCSEMKSLESVIHVSTAYSYCTRKEIDEVFYEPPVKYEKLINVTDSLDDHLLDSITPTLLNGWPNTYAYTKAIAEDAVRDLGKQLPIAVFRPSIVLASWKEPISGWIDNIYGPTGVITGAGLGVLRTLQADKKCVADLIPIDLVVNCLIATAWNTAIKKRDHISEEVPIYNYVSSPQKPITWGEYMDLNYKYGMECPSVKCIWYYSLTLHKTRIMHLIYTLFLHYLPALLVDSVLFVTGNKPQMLKVYKKISKFTDVIAYFSTKQWKFHNNNTQSLWTKLNNNDKNTYLFDVSQLDWDNYFATHVIGIRMHVTKDPPSTIPQGKKRWFRFYVMHQLVKVTFAFLFLRILWATFSYVLPIN